jgi:hypothetical protein
MEVIVIESEAFKEIIKRIDQIDSNIEQIRSLLSPENPLKDTDDPTPTLTIDDILKRYKISRQTFFNYRKHFPLMGRRIGRYNHFKTKDVEVFFDEICKLKSEKPELFVFTFRKPN